MAFGFSCCSQNEKNKNVEDALKNRSGRLASHLTVQPLWNTTCRGLIEAIGDGEEEINLGNRSVPVRQYASWFNFKGADQQKTVGVLSGT